MPSSCNTSGLSIRLKEILSPSPLKMESTPDKSATKSFPKPEVPRPPYRPACNLYFGHRAMQKVLPSSFLYLFEFVFDRRQQPVGECFVNLLFVHLVPVLAGIGNVGDEDLEIGFQSFRRPFDSLHSIAVITDDHRPDTFLLQFEDLHVGDFLPEGCHDGDVRIVVKFEFARKSDCIENALRENDHVSLLVTNGIVVIEQFGKVVIG